MCTQRQRRSDGITKTYKERDAQYPTDADRGIYGT